MANTAFKSLGDVIMVLATSTVIVYEVLNPIVTNDGACSVANQAITAVLVTLCADEDSLKKAMRRKAERNLDSLGTDMKSKSLLSFSPLSIHSKLSSVGFNLGSSKSQVEVSTNVLRHMEYDRLTVIPKASTVLTTTYVDEEEANATSDGQLLSHLIGEVSEVGLDEDGISSLYELKATDRKSKST